MLSMLRQIKKLVPRWLVDFYHVLFVYLSAVFYRFPSSKMTVIGVTGTNGKSSTTQFIGQLLMLLGETVGWTTTESFRVGDKWIANKTRMTMLGRSMTHKLMRDMVSAGCKYAVIEVSSEGVKQHRIGGISFDAGVFTNLTPEHIEAHGGFANYKDAKLEFFRKVCKNGGFGVVNLEDEHYEDFARAVCGRVIGYGREDEFEVCEIVDEFVLARDISLSGSGITMEVDGRKVNIPVAGGFNVYNVLAAIAVVYGLGFDMDSILDVVGGLMPIPGRLEVYEHDGVTIIVDYAHEPAGLEALFDVVEDFGCERILHVFGSAGGDRDKSRRPVMGKLAALHDDFVFVCDEDPRDEDPMTIIDAIADAAVAGGMKDGENLFRIQDREKAISEAIGMAEAGDCVLITGKGNESVIIMENGRTIPSDDREIVLRLIG